MSNWTHVAGVIRIDSIRLSDKTPDFDEMIGKECLFDSPDQLWQDCYRHPEKYLPMGSEGSLQKSVWINPERSCMAAYTVSIFGDLRDHNDPVGVVDWFEALCGKIGTVRNAVITVENEVIGKLSYTYGM